MVNVEQMLKTVNERLKSDGIDKDVTSIAMESYELSRSEIDPEIDQSISSNFPEYTNDMIMAHSGFIGNQVLIVVTSLNYDVNEGSILYYSLNDM